ncbi:hypothetical protein QBC47DRAFT_426809 [Echria macrotheca]|uniref:Uncharacterized protein n=1 Tax=Echria macrotheca TaxID=438768 RepID=A0AAJ0B0H6_9PEZI|nr:hypothetical protein QBC47DRAFT_426809 [Echria macrotheca]
MDQDYRSDQESPGHQVSGPGIFLANSGVLPQYASVLPYDKYVKWYEGVHIPDWMGAKPGAITTAWRYQSADPASARPFLVGYKYPDVAATSAPEFVNVTLSDPSLPEGGPVTKFIDITASWGPHIETWRSGSTGDDRGPLLVTEEIDLGGNMTIDEFHAWYRESYIYQLSMLDGWRRTSRFDTTGSGNPRWLTLHEFEERAFAANTTKITTLLGDPEKYQAVTKSAKRIELGLWRLVRVYGDGTVPWGLPGDDNIL